MAEPIYVVLSDGCSVGGYYYRTRDSAEQKRDALIEMASFSEVEIFELYQWEREDG